MRLMLLLRGHFNDRFMHYPSPHLRADCCSNGFVAHDGLAVFNQTGGVGMCGKKCLETVSHEVGMVDAMMVLCLLAFCNFPCWDAARYGDHWVGRA